MHSLSFFAVVLSFVTASAGAEITITTGAPAAYASLVASVLSAYEAEITTAPYYSFVQSVLSEIPADAYNSFGGDPAAALSAEASIYSTNTWYSAVLSYVQSVENHVTSLENSLLAAELTLPPSPMATATTQTGAIVPGVGSASAVTTASSTGAASRQTGAVKAMMGAAGIIGLAIL